MRRILVVCTANQCRSPMAEGLIRARWADAPRSAGPVDEITSTDRLLVRSAGTWAEDGHPATPHAVTTMAERRIDIRDHRSREVTAPLLAESDLILAMTSGHVQALHAEFPEARDRVHLFSALKGEAWSVADPVGGSLDDYRATARLLEELIESGWGIILGEVPIVEGADSAVAPARSGSPG